MTTYLFLKKNKNLFILFIFSLLIYIIKSKQELVEKLYSTFLYEIVSNLSLTIVNKISFSVGDMLYLITPFLFYRFLIKKNQTRRRLLTKTIVAFLFFYVVFNLQWGLNYYRVPLKNKANNYKSYSINELLETTNFFITKTNDLHNILSINDTISVKYDNLNFDIEKESIKSIKKTAFVKNKNLDLKIKKSIFSTPISYMGFGGYINPFTLEAQINYNIPTINVPTTICHEIGHQLGYSAEDEANYIGIISTIKSENKHIQYSGYSQGLKYLINEIYIIDKKLYEQLLSTIKIGVLKNYKEAGEEWKKYDNPFETYFKKVYDLFLKANNQTKGIKSYNLVVDLLVNKYTNLEF